MESITVDEDTARRASPVETLPFYCRRASASTSSALRMMLITVPLVSCLYRRSQSRKNLAIQGLASNQPQTQASVPETEILVHL